MSVSKKQRENWEHADTKHTINFAQPYLSKGKATKMIKNDESGLRMSCSFYLYLSMIKQHPTAFPNFWQGKVA